MDLVTIRKVMALYISRLAEVEGLAIEKLEVGNLSLVQIHEHVELYFAEYLCKSKDKVNLNDPVVLLYKQLLNMIEGSKGNVKKGWFY